MNRQSSVKRSARGFSCPFYAFYSESYNQQYHYGLVPLAGPAASCSDSDTSDSSEPQRRMTAPGERDPMSLESVFWIFSPSPTRGEPDPGGTESGLIRLKRTAWDWDH